MSRRNRNICTTKTEYTEPAAPEATFRARLHIDHIVERQARKQQPRQEAGKTETTPAEQARDEQPEGQPEPSTPVEQADTSQSNTTRAEPNAAQPAGNLDQSRQEVADALDAALRARLDAASPPRPDPDHPALAETHTAYGLADQRATMRGLANEGVGRRYDVHSVRVDSVTFDNADGRETATVEACEISDEEHVVLSTGEVLPDPVPLGLVDVNELRLEATMHRVDGAWRLALSLHVAGG